MPDRTPNCDKTPEDTEEGAIANDADRWAGEPLEGSGFEEEIPQTGFEWRG